MPRTSASSDIRTDGPVSFTLTHDGVSVDARLRGAGRAQRDQRGGRGRRAAHARLRAGARRPRGRGIRAARCAGSSCTACERGVSVFDDYAHHPTEVAAALAAARTVVGDGRIIAIQQPHTYSRTQADVPRVRRGARAVRRSHRHARRLRRARGPGAGRHRRARLGRVRRPGARALRRRLAGRPPTTRPPSRATATTSSRSAAATCTRSSRRCSRRCRGRRTADPGE